MSPSKSSISNPVPVDCLSLQIEDTGAGIAGEQTIVSSASIGIILGTSNYASSEDILRDADVAMYRAKESGRASWLSINLDIQSFLFPKNLKNYEFY